MTANSLFQPLCLRCGGAHPGSALMKRVLFTILILSILPLALRAQETQQGIQYGNFNVQQSTELGYRFSGVNGNPSMYEYYVALPSGPRVLSQEFALRSLTRKGSVVDDLTVSSFGYGGDPETATRLRAAKDHWYDFTGIFRRDVNSFDYNLLGNPLNPINPYIVSNNSPHAANLVRRMQDYALVLAPQSRFRVRLGYNRNTNEGPSYTTFHEGTDVLLFQPFKAISDTYSFGADYRLAPRTTVSYDQSFEQFRNDTYSYDNNFNFVLSNNTPVDAGLVFNAPLNQPCAGAFTANPLGGPAILKATCNGYQSYSRTGAVRSLFPTEKLSLQSNYFPRLDVTASGLYSSGDSQVLNYNESFLGLVTRTNERVFHFTGPATTRRVLANIDFGATYQITDKLHISESLHYYNSRLPGAWLSAESALFGAVGGSSMLVAPGVFDSANCPPPYTAATCPKHSNSSGPDVATDYYLNAQNSLLLTNTVDLQYDPFRRFGMHAGYRWTERHIEQSLGSSSDSLYYPPSPTRGNTLTCTNRLADGTCEIIGDDIAVDVLDITQHSGLFGVWLRPVDSLRMNADVEIASADGAVTRISPRNSQHYKFRSTWKPLRWATFNANLNWLEQRNRRIEGTFNGGAPDQDHLDHTRTFAFSTMLLPSDRVSIDLGFDYQDVYSSTDSCINLGSINSMYPACDFGPGSVLQNALGQWQYQATVYGAHALAIVKPAKKLTLSAGYDLTDSTGSSLYYSLTLPGAALQPNALQPQGSLYYMWHKPVGSIAYNLTDHWAAKGAWGYYDYNERGWQGPVVPRDFHANTGTLSLRYAF